MRQRKGCGGAEALPDTIITLYEPSKKEALMAADATISLGKRMKELRQSKGLRIADVAKRGKLAESTISKAENGQTSLTYEKLVQVAAGLDVGISELFTTPQAPEQVEKPPSPAPVLGRRAISREGEGGYVGAGLYEYWYLCSDLSQKNMIPMLGRTSARTIEQFETLVRHPGQEFLFIIEGEMEVRSEFYEPVRLRVGDCMYFDSGMGHAYLSVSNEPCRFLVVCAPQNGTNSE